MQRAALLAVSVMTMLAAGCAAIGPAGYDGPLLVAEDHVPGVPENIESAAYWTSVSGNAEDLIMTFDEITEFNENNPVRSLALYDVTELPEQIDGAAIRADITGAARALLTGRFYITGELQLEQAERERIAALMDTTGVSDIIFRRLGMLLHPAMGRAWPTDIPLMIDPGDIEFDQGVASSIDMGEPVALLHTSSDGRWVYVQTYGFPCWVPSEAVAFGPDYVVQDLTDRSYPLVATGNRVSVYSTPDEHTAVGSLQMGSALPLRAAGAEQFEVLIPGRGEHNELVAKRGYVHRSDNVSIGWLPYTLENVYRQCFAVYGRRYGWGGMYGERDCSSYIMDVFRCFGFALPRNSARLIQASPAVIDLTPYDRATRLDILRSCPAGITILGYPGHVMIYLGAIADTSYIINSVWAWRTPTGDGRDIVHRIARVTVSDLLLGDGSEKGALIDKVTSLAIFGKYVITSDAE